MSKPTNIPEHTDRAHAEFSPSSLKYVAGCPAFHGTEGTSAAAEMGTRIHEALEVRDPSALQDEKELDIYTSCAEMEDEFLLSEFGGSARDEHYEIRMEIKLDGTSTFGTCDRLSIAEQGLAVMGDYKTGISTIYAPRDNEQAITYAIGAFQKFPSIEKLIFAFYGPQRHHTPLTGTFLREELDDMVARISDVIKNGESVRPLWGGGNCPPVKACNPTQNCRFCRHEERCPALGGLVLDVAANISRREFTNIDLENVEEPAALEELYNIAKIVEGWAKRTKARATDMAKDGVAFPNLKLRSMGATTSVTDNQKLIELALAEGVEEKDLMGVASFPLRKTADLVGKSAASGKKGEKSGKFVDTCQEHGILVTGNTRYTLS